jgi:ABC-type transporter Mla subunit MlaD
MAEITIRLSSQTLKLVAAAPAVPSLLCGLRYALGSGVLEANYELRVFLPETQGIQVSAPVRADGMDVGVGKVRLAPSSLGPDRRVEPTSRIKRRYQNSIAEDSWASVVSELLGEAFVNIARGASTVPLNPGQEIRSFQVKDVSFMDRLEALGKIKGCKKAKAPGTRQSCRRPRESPPGPP